MNRKMVLSGIIVLIIVVALFLFDRSRFITYDELIAEMIGDEDISQITIFNRIDLQQRDFSTVIEDAALINRIVHEPVMTLKKDLKQSTVSPELFWGNRLTIMTSDGDKNLYFSPTYIHTGRFGYEVILGEDTPNNLYFLIQDELRRNEIEWTEHDFK